MAEPDPDDVRLPRSPVRTDHKRTPSQAEFELARSLVSGDPGAAWIAGQLRGSRGPRPLLTVEAFYVGAQLNAFETPHQGELTDIAAQFNAMTPDQRAALGIDSWDAEQAYNIVTKLFERIAWLLEDAPADEFNYTNTYVRGAIDPTLPRSKTRAIDGTDFESCGVLHGEVALSDLDGESDAEDEAELAQRPKETRRRRAKVLALDEDGRKIYTADCDARAGYRTATDSRPGGTYIGFEVHLAVQARDVKHTNYVDEVRFGPRVPSFVTSYRLVAAGTHRAKAALPMVDLEGKEINHLLVDRGYTGSANEYWAFPIAERKIDQTFMLMKRQRGERDFDGEGLIVDAQLFSKQLTDDLLGTPNERGLGRDPFPLPSPREANSANHESREPFNNRGPLRLRPHTAWDSEGYRTFKCPYCTGKLFDRNNTKKPRVRQGSKVRAMREKATQCCGARKTYQKVSVRDLPYWQPYVYGSTAHCLVYNGRQVVEKVNGQLKTQVLALSRKSMRVLGRVKRSFLLMFTLAAYNIECAREFKAKEAEINRAKKKERAKRRTKALDATNGPLIPKHANASSSIHATARADTADRDAQRHDGRPPP